jgi:hypothetical protein
MGKWAHLVEKCYSTKPTEQAGTLLPGPSDEMGDKLEAEKPERAELPS